MHKFLILLGAAIIASPFAHANDHPYKSLIPDAEKVGEGRMSYLLWDIYDAELHAPGGTWDRNKPFALKLSYLMEIEGKRIADRSAAEMRDQGTANEVQLATWHSQMRKIFPKVERGQTIIGVYTKNSETVFFKNNEEIGRIKDPDFSESFFGIWLNKETNAPNLRRKLLNGKDAQMARN